MKKGGATRQDEHKPVSHVTTGFVLLCIQLNKSLNHIHGILQGNQTTLPRVDK